MLAIAGCPAPVDVNPTSDSAAVTGLTAATSSTGGETMTTTTSSGEPTTTTGEPPYDGVIAPVVRTYWPLGEPAAMVVHDPSPELARLEIVAGGQSFPGQFDGVDRLLFADVPEDIYLLRQQQAPDPLVPEVPGRVLGTVTEARELGTFAGTYAGRPGVALTDDPATRIELWAPDMPALGPEDQFEIYSYNADAQLLVFPDLDPMASDGSPGLGDTVIENWSVPWRPSSARSGWPLVGVDDDLWLGLLVAGRLVEDPTPAQLQDAWSYAQVYRLAARTQLWLAGPMTAGATTTASGAFSPVEARTVAVDLRAAEFMAELQIYDSALKSVGCFVSVVLEPGVERPILGMTPNLGGVNVFGQDVAVDPMCPPDACDPEVCDSCDSMFVLPGDRTFDVTYGNPYEGGTETLVVQCSRYVFVPEPGGAGYDWLVSDLVVSGRLAALTQGPIVPKMGLVRDLAINSAALGPEETREGVGTTPKITFKAPAYGAPDVYTVIVRRLDDVAGLEGVSDRRTVATIRTAFTSVTLPEGILEPGGHYYVSVAAERGRGLTGAMAASHELYVSRAITGVFTP